MNTKEEQKQQFIDTLGDEQRTAFEAVEQGHNVLITGNAGTGKSHLLNGISQFLNVNVTASTGIAALNVSGATIHSWSGLGLGRLAVPLLVFKLKQKERDYNDTTLARLRACKRLAIDEISMLDGRYLEHVDELLKLVNENDKPFGGVQMIFLGDFLQLPPVVPGGVPQFAFESNSWRNAAVEVHMLNKCFRQDNQQFADMLSEIRMGRVTPEIVSFLNERFTAVDPDSDHPGLIVHTHNDGCDKINVEGLRSIDGEPTTYTATDTGEHQMFIDQLDKNCLASRQLTLKVGARVMLLKNLDVYNGLANGSMGTVTRLTRGEAHILFDGRDYPTEICRAEWEVTNGTEVLARRRQLPLRLGYAVTVHKSQGMSLDKIYAHLDKCFSPGQAYVAMSRARTAEGLFLRGGKNVNIMANSRAVDFYIKAQALRQR